MQQQSCVQCESAIRTALSPHHPFLSRCHTCWCGERGHCFHDSSSPLLRVSVPFCSIVVSHNAVSGAWFPSGGCHDLVMVGSWCTVLATHVHSCSFAVSLSRCSVVGSQVLPRCALLHISCCLAPFTHDQVPLANALHYWRECLKESVPYSLLQPFECRWVVRLWLAPCSALDG